MFVIVINFSLKQVFNPENNSNHITLLGVSEGWLILLLFFSVLIFSLDVGIILLLITSNDVRDRPANA